MKSRDQTEGTEADPPEPPKKPAAPRVPQCTRYVQKRLAAHLPGMDDLLEKSRKDAATLKALWQMGKLDEQESTPRKRKGSLAREMLRER